MLQEGRQSQVAEKLANIWGSVYGGSSPLQQLTSGRWTGGDPTQFGETDVKIGLKEERSSSSWAVEAEEHTAQKGAPA